jgi:hypothetical protein
MAKAHPLDALCVQPPHVSKEACSAHTRVNEWEEHTQVMIFIISQVIKDGTVGFKV